MRYFQATEITRPEADHIRLTSDELLKGRCHLASATKWYDVRCLTETELMGFVDQLMRGELELIRAGRDTPH